VPVVATSVGGVPEIVRDGEDGFLVPYFDKSVFARAIVDALQRDWDRDGLSRRARARSWETTAGAVAEELELAVRSFGAETAESSLPSSKRSWSSHRWP